MNERLPSALLVLVSALGCSGERWVIGEGADAGASAAAELTDAASSITCSAGAAAGIPPPGAPPALAGAQLGSWLATLVGAESQAFPAGDVLLRLTREAATLRFDGGSPLPPLVDPAAGYLCTSSVESCASPAGFVAGFDYRLVEPSSRGSIASFALFLDEPWDAWCRLQAPVEIVQPGCAPRHAVERPYDEARWADGCAVRRGEEWTPLPCDRLATVERGVCACTAEGCRARARLQPVNLRMVGPDSLEGALWFSADRAQILQFSRIE